jgi:putative selenate reductase molybdopterin-binding subunit
MIQLKLNGQPEHWDIAPGDILLDVLRRQGYVGAKRGCETGSCGACTVLVDGKPIDSCLMFAAQADGREIVTIEGLAAADSDSCNETKTTLHPVQEAFLDHGAVQCGFCTPGMILNASTFDSGLNEAEVRRRMAGNLCRCTGYAKPVAALTSQAKLRPARATVGQSVRKVDGVKLVTGREAFTDDFHMPGMLVGKILPSPHAHARIKRIDARRARDLSGVHAVLTYQNVPRVPHTTAGQAWPEPSPYDTYLLDNKVRFVGDRVAAVAAETRAIAEEALRLIEVEYEILPAVLDMEAALRPGAPIIHDEPDSTNIHDASRNIAGHISKQLGDIEEGFRQSDLIFEREFRTQRQQHCPIEPHVTIAWVDADNRLVIRSSTQVPFHSRRQVAMILQIPVQRVHIIKPRIGGGFGGKQEMLLEDITGALALATRRPVKIEYTRAEEFFMARSRHPQILRMKMGVKRDGTIMASELKVLATTGAYGSHSTTVQGNTGSKVLPLYRAPHMLFECDIVYTNAPVAGAFRGYGCPQGFFAQETLVDEIAHELGLDPIEFRLKNAIRLGDTDELSAVLGEGRKGLPRLIRSCGLPECLSRGAAAIDWVRKRQHRNDPDSSLKRGVGVAATMQGSGIAGVDWASALLRMNEDGSFHLYAGASDVGAGADTVLSQIAAETLGVTLDKILITTGDTDFTPFDVGAYASSTTIISGGAVKKAAEKAREQVLAVAARMLGAPAESLICRDNRVSAPDGKSVTMSQIALQSMYKEKTLITGGASHFNTDSPPPFCVTFAEVEVDTETGRIKVLNLLSAVDPGVAINPALAEGQVEGAAAQGMGLALTEEMVLDASGRMLNPNFLDYKMCGPQELACLKTILVETNEPLGPYGAKSISEVPINGPAPAIANAVFHAVGIRLRKLPMKPEDVLQALRTKPAVREPVEDLVLA